MDSHEIWDTHSLFVFSANFVHANMISYGGEQCTSNISAWQISKSC